MKKLSMILSGAALAVCAGFFLNGCSSSTSPGTVSAPSNLMALSKNASTISVKWTRASGDTTVDTIVLSSSGAPTQALATSNTATSADLSGLSTGTVYTITVASSGGRSSSINWMTANRTNGLRLYQFSSLQMSGLVLNGPGNQAEVVSPSLTTSGTLDFFLDDSTHAPGIAAPGISFEGAQFLNAAGVTTPYRASFIDPNPRYIVGGLDSDYSSTDFSTEIADTINSATQRTPNYDIPSASNFNTRGSRVLLVETTDGNFAKVEIVADPSTGLLYSGTWPDQYITVNVSYQPTPNQPYAGRALPHYNGYVVRHSAQ